MESLQLFSNIAGISSSPGAEFNLVSSMADLMSSIVKLKLSRVEVATGNVGSCFFSDVGSLKTERNSDLSFE